eukprot:scaffold131300_cov39-Tisochrysis_lutea.AAC.1
MPTAVVAAGVRSNEWPRGEREGTPTYSLHCYCPLRATHNGRRRLGARGRCADCAGIGRHCLP